MTVNTEYIHYQIREKNNSRFIFEDVEVTGLDSVIYKNFNGSFELSNDVKVTIERIAFGSAVITIEKAKDSSTGKLFNGVDGKLLSQTPSFVEFIIDSLSERAGRGQTIILPIDGDVTIGRSVDMEIYGEGSSILRSGNISLTGQSQIFSEEFDANSQELLLGDQLKFDAVTNKAFGFVTLNENPGIQAAYRVKARRARILKPGLREIDGGKVIRARPLDRFLHASSFQFLSLLFGCIIVIINIISFFMDSIDFKKDNKELFE